MKKIVDSAGWIEYIGGGPIKENYRSHILETDNLITPTIIMYEVHKYILRERGADAAWEATSMMMETSLIPINEGIATYAAELSLKHKLPMTDSIIYATAITYGATIVTSDAHFKDLPQVEYIPRIAGN